MIGTPTMTPDLVFCPVCGRGPRGHLEVYVAKERRSLPLCMLRNGHLGNLVRKLDALPIGHAPAPAPAGCQPRALTARGAFWRDMLAAAQYERDRRDHEGWRDGYSTPRLNEPAALTGPIPEWMR